MGGFSHLSARDADSELPEDLFGLELVNLHGLSPFIEMNEPKKAGYIPSENREKWAAAPPGMGGAVHAWFPLY
jgi:hypothetical protein